LNAQRLLEQHGFTVTTAANGKEAFDALVAAYEAGAPPHIAIIDMQVPCVADACLQLAACVC
jgi:CheY-like chemotaxis protein